jgi:hypothetical protein
MSGNSVLNSFCNGVRTFLLWIILPILITFMVFGFIEILIDFLFWQGYE